MKRLALGLLVSAAAVALVTAAIALLEPYVPVLSLGALYVFAVLPVAVWWGLGLATAVSIASMLAFNFFFLEPRHTFALYDSSNWLALAVYLVTAVVVSALATRARRRAEVAIEAEALRRSDAMKTAVLRAVSHDLRSPLTAIVAAASGLADPQVRLDREDHDELVASIRAEAERLDRIVGNLLDMSRLQSGVAEPHRELWTVDDLVSRALEQVGPGSERVQTQLGEHVPPVEVDATQIERVLVNLIDNALKFSPPGTPVLVQTEPRGRELLVHVHDSGGGVAQADRELVFEPFRRAKAESRGAGLGLAIARGFAEVNGGRVWTDDGPDGHFVLALPVGV
jgi:two-component system, OmpR family, sensor histidine kinase KdpD